MIASAGVASLVMTAEETQRVEFRAPALLIAIVLLGLNGFFVASEFALLAARRSRIEQLAADGDRRAGHALAGLRELTLMLAGAQLGITMCSLGLGAVAEPALAGIIENALGRVFTLSSTAEHIVMPSCAPASIRVSSRNPASAWPARRSPSAASCSILERRAARSANSEATKNPFNPSRTIAMSSAGARNSTRCVSSAVITSAAKPADPIITGRPIR